MLLLHVTTRLKGRRHDELLKLKGFAGFPTLAFMDQSGDVIACPKARTIDALRASAAAADAYVALREKTVSGDPAARLHLFVEDLALNRYDYIRGSLRFAAMRRQMSPELRTKARQNLTDLQYTELTSRLRRNYRELGLDELLKQWLELNLEFFQAGRIPGDSRAAGMLASVMKSAYLSKNATLYAKALQEWKDRFGTETRFRSSLGGFERRLAELRRG